MLPFFQLGQHISVHTYGRCGRLPCPGRDARECLLALDRRGYDFLLVAEPHLCQHFQTSALWQALRHARRMVPVAFGGVDYSAAVRTPPQGDETNTSVAVVIDALQSRGPEALARYLLHLHRNPRLLERYRRWRTDFDVVLEPWTCALCRRLRERSLPEKQVRAKRPLCTKWPNLDFGGKRRR